MELSTLLLEVFQTVSMELERTDIVLLVFSLLAYTVENALYCVSST